MHSCSSSSVHLLFCVSSIIITFIFQAALIYHPLEPKPMPKMLLGIYFRSGLAMAMAIAAMATAAMAAGRSNVQLNDDVLGLMVFKSDLEDSSAASYLGSWNEDDNTPCSWQFVRCNPTSGRVSEVSLDGLGLSGKMSGRGLEKLQHLKLLSLSRNNFTGNISPELGFIPNLQILNLSQNRLSGTIPTSLLISNSIKFLDVSDNFLSGPFPFLSNCYHRNNCSLKLKYLSLSGNSFQGPLPKLFNDNNSFLESLNTLNLSRNQFSGGLLDTFSSIKNGGQLLRVLDVSHNEFSGGITLGLGLHYLKQLVLRGNQFTGPVPVDIGFICPHLNTLDLSNNLFSGELSDSIQSLHSLTMLNLSSNMLSGEFPQWIGNLNSLEALDLSSNSITGSLPWTIGNDLKSLKYLSLSNNKITGNIPTSLAFCSELSVIRLRGNAFNGSIPDALLFQLGGLEEIDLSNNQLTSKSAAAAALRTPNPAPAPANLRYINLSWNNLDTELEQLILRGAPHQPGFFWNLLTVLDLRNAALYGSIPVDICDSKNLEILQLDGNSLTGPIPDKIGNCSSLTLLSLSYNKLSGSIPKSLSNLRELKILELEMNELSGEIPGELRNLGNLLAVNISYNRLIGRLPEGGVFQSLDPTALQGNLGICSPLFKGPCKMNVSKPLVIDPFTHRIPNPNPNQNPIPSPNNSSVLHQARFLSISSIIAISAALLIATGVILVTLLNLNVSSTRTTTRHNSFVDNKVKAALESMCSSSSSFSSRSVGSLQSHPTAGKLILFENAFSTLEWMIRCKPEKLLENASEIGRGVFGTVYKVSFQGKVVAIKKLLISDIIQYPQDFDRQVRDLGRARHPNLISLEGYYWTPQLQLLVSAYASGYVNLQTRLLDQNPPLSWPNKFKIIMGTAKGLAYLHHSFRPPIIHYNIKPTNILVDENCSTKISDFGLARLLNLSKFEKHVMNNRFQNAAGYVAPELACQSLRVTEKCDVYGFGMLMMELVSDGIHEQNVSGTMSERVRAMVEQGNLLDCVDPSMGHYLEDEVLPVLKLALVCISHIPSSRPSMNEVVQILQVIRTPPSHSLPVPHTNTTELY